MACKRERRSPDIIRTENRMRKDYYPRMPEEESDAIGEQWMKDIGVIREDGTFDEAQARKELHDYSFLLSQVPAVYEHVTGGLLSKPNYFSAAVISCHDEHVEQETKGIIKELDEHEIMEVIEDWPTPLKKSLSLLIEERIRTEEEDGARTA